jgi:hypothetical protein
MKRPFANKRPIGPIFNTSTTLVESASHNIPLPQFKAKTFRWDNPRMQFRSTGGVAQLTGTIDSPGGSYVEEGTSLSLDGAYAEQRNLVLEGGQDFITYIFPIDQNNDIPFFYLSPIGKTREKIDGVPVVLESPSYAGETEVAVRNEFNIGNATSVVITLSNEDIKEIADEKMKSTSFDRRKTEIEEDMDSLIEELDEVRDKFEVLYQMPDSKFRLEALDRYNKVKDLDYRDDWDKVERTLRPIHKAVARTYNIEYDEVVNTAKSKLSKQ